MASALPFTFRPIKMYDNKEFHAYVHEGLYMVGPWHWSGRDSTFFKRFAPIPEDIEDRFASFAPTFATLETLQKIWPRSAKYDHTQYSFVGSPLVKTYTDGSGKITIKAAFKHRVTGDIVLLSGTNTLPKEGSNPALTEGWNVYTADMVAPAIFWDILLANI
jgi:hypothetical protein